MRRIAYLISATLLAALALAAAPAGAAPATQQARSCDGSEGVYLYEGLDYTGTCLRFTEDAADLSQFAFNNATSSVRIVGNLTGVLYVDQNFANAASAFGFDSNDLRGSFVGDNRTSSLRVIRGFRQPVEQGCRGDGVYLYELRDFQGRCVRYTGDESDLRRQAFNNQAQSVRVVGGYTATLYADAGFLGPETAVRSDIANLTGSSVGSRATSAIRVGRGGQGTCSGDGVYLYEHPNFQGRCVRLTADANDLRQLNFDDTTSSIRLVGGYTATLFRDLNGAGTSTNFIADDPNLGDNPIGDNQATSVRVARTQAPPPAPSGNVCDGSEGAYLYEHPNFQGRCLRFATGVGDLRPFTFDDTVSSVRIVGSWSLTLFADLSGGGTSEVFTRDDPNLADNRIGDNRATSLAVARTQAPPPAPSGTACDGSEGVYLYEGTNYRGACIRVTGDIGDLRVTELNDAVSSVRIFGRYSVVLFRDLNFTGASSTFVESDPDLRNDGIGDNQATSLQVRRR
jgi:hypothetical protein